MGARVGDKDRYVLDVLSTILSGQSGRLFLELRDRQSLAYAISSSSLEGLDPGYFLVHVGTSLEKVEQALAGVYLELSRLRDGLVDVQELDRARRYLVGTHAIDLHVLRNDLAQDSRWRVGLSQARLDLKREKDNQGN